MRANWGAYFVLLGALGCAACSSDSSGTTAAASPTLTSGTGAGLEEGNLLTEVAINQAARGIIHQAGVENEPVVVVPGAAGFDISAWDIFQGRVDALDARFQADLAGFDEHAPAIHAEVFFDLGTAVDATNALSQLISRFGSNITLSGAQTQPTDYMLAVAICGNAKKGCILPNPTIMLEARDDIAKQMKRIADDAAKASPIITTELAKKNGNAQHDANIDASIQNLKNDISDAQTLATWLYTPAQAAPAPSAPSPGGAPPSPAPASPSPAPAPAAPSAPASSPTSNYVAVAVADALQKALATNPHILSVQVNNAASGLYSKSNLWSTVGAVPFYVSAGVTVNYVAYDYVSDGDKKTLRMTKAGLLGALTPYHSVGTVLKAVTLEKTGECAKPREGDTAKFCAQ